MIVRFLDHANRKIDGFIRAKRKLIGLLNEQKQAIIHRAVTRGLHPDVPLKPSGIPWLGDIPKHWEVRRLRQIAAVNPSKSESADAIRRNPLVTFLPMERVKANGTIDASELIPASNISTGFTYFRRGDVVVAKITPCFENGKGAFLDSLPPILEQQAIALMQEYRTRLTADIVTGKLDVREAAARLPEVKSDQSDESDQSDLSELSDESDPSDPSDLSDETGDSHLEDEP